MAKGITAKQRAARKKNMAKARAARKRRAGFKSKLDAMLGVKKVKTMSGRTMRLATKVGKTGTFIS
jgi:hypothetical protein